MHGNLNNLTRGTSLAATLEETTTKACTAAGPAAPARALPSCLAPRTPDVVFKFINLIVRSRLAQVENPITRHSHSRRDSHILFVHAACLCTFRRLASRATCPWCRDMLRNSADSFPLASGKIVKHRTMPIMHPQLAIDEALLRSCAFGARQNETYRRVK